MKLGLTRVVYVLYVRFYVNWQEGDAGDGKTRDRESSLCVAVNETMVAASPETRYRSEVFGLVNALFFRGGRCGEFCGRNKGHYVYEIFGNRSTSLRLLASLLAFSFAGLTSIPYIIRADGKSNEESLRVNNIRSRVGEKGCIVD